MSVNGLSCSVVDNIHQMMIYEAFSVCNHHCIQRPIEKEKKIHTQMITIECRLMQLHADYSQQGDFPFYVSFWPLCVRIVRNI